MMKHTLTFLALILTIIISACSDDRQQNVETSACQNVTFQQINEDPHQFIDERICIDGFLNRSMSTWHIFGTGQENANLLHRGIGLGISLDLESTSEWSYGDIVSASGIFELVEECWISKTIRMEQDIYPDDEICHDIRTPFQLVNVTTDVTAQPDHSSACREISFEDLDAEPLAFAYQHVCLEALIQIEFEGMGLFSPTGITDPFGRLLSPGMGYMQAAALGLRTRDLVSAKGLIIPSEGCLGPDTFCIGGSDLYFRNSSVEFISRIPARDQCETLTVDDIENDEDDFDYRMICIEGQIIYHEGRFGLVPEGFEGTPTQYNSFVLNFLFMDDGARRLLPGDRVSVAALTWRERMKVYELDVLEALNIWEICEQTTLAAVHADPHAFEGKVVCLEGYLQPEYGDWTYFLPEADEPPLAATSTMVAIGAFFPSDDTYYHGDVEPVRAAGMLFESYGCRDNEKSLEQLTAEHEAADPEDRCPPANRSLYFNIYEVE